VDDVRLEYAGRVVHVRGQPQIAVFHRPEFDAYLAEQARQRGVQIQENEPVKAFRLDRDGVTVSTPRREYQARVLVGADGSKGSVRAYMNRQGARAHPARAHPARSQAARLLEVLAPVDETAAAFSERYARFDFTPVQEYLQGYFWEFPARVRGMAAYNRGVYDARLSQSRPRADLPRLLRMAVGRMEAAPVEPRPEGHPIHWFSPWNRLALPRLLLVGDAAGADPLFGEGIAPALAYGRVAARALEHTFATGDFSFRDYRWRLFRSPVGRYLLVRWAVAFVSYHLSGQRWFMHALWSAGQALDALWPEPPPLYKSVDE
jgi:flavin-dependent dehydrogenase